MLKIFQLHLILLMSISLFGQEKIELFNETSEVIKENIGLDEVRNYSLLEVDSVVWNSILNEHPGVLELKLPLDGEMLTLSLNEVRFFDGNLKIRTASGNDVIYNNVSKSIYFNGAFEEYPESHFALSVLNNEIIGVGNIPGKGDLNLGKLIGGDKYIFYKESEINGHNEYECATDESYNRDKLGLGYDPGKKKGPAPKSLGDCVGLYFEVDHDIFLDKGGVVGATDYITALFNEIYLLYDMDGMTVYLSDILVWDVASPYAGIVDTGTLLDLFGTTTPVWTGDLGHFVSYRGGGGLAWLDVFCHPNQALRKAVSDINATFAAIPVFSWTIEVVAHEMGHNFGSPHTHACFWNGDMTAIDGCGPDAGYGEGCTAPLPVQGTIMSYCHLVGGVGIDLGLGFGPQPSGLIQDEIINASCLSGCSLNPFMDAEITDAELVSATCAGDTVMVDVSIKNNGNEALTSMNILVYIDGGLVQTIAWTGSVLEDAILIYTVTGIVLPAGTYTMTILVEDPNGTDDAVLSNSTYDFEFTLTPPPLVEVTAFENITCHGEEDGSIDLTVSGGAMGAYDYLWDNGAGTMEDPTSLEANSYTVVVTDAAGCAVQVTQDLTQPDELLVTAAATVAMECYLDEIGEATVVADGGVPGYSYVWSSGGTGTTETLLSGGEHTVTVEDGVGCSITDTVTIVSPPEIIATATVTQASCGVPDGAINAVVTGGVPVYTYAWETGEVVTTITGVLAGDYDLTITDANGCVALQTITVTEDPAPEISLDTLINNTCYGGSDGAISVSGANIQGVPSYMWDTGFEGEEITGVTAGTYLVVLTDESNCSDSVFYVVEQGDEIIIEETVTSVSCNGDDDGTIYVNVSGGVPVYDYNWSTGAITAIVEDLLPGEYSITITDLIGCENELSIVVSEPDELSIEGVATNEYCDGENGTVSVTLTGGTPTYSYMWSTGDVTNELTGLSAGIYNVLVTDENGCSTSYGAILDNLDDFEAIVSKTDVECAGEASGTGTVAVLSGEAPYVYDWSDGQTTATASGLVAGEYSVTVTDVNACEETFDIEVLEPEGIEVASSVSNEVFGGDGQITISVIGGTAPFTYAWSSGETTEDISSLVAGSYSVTITDGNGCSFIFTFVVDSQLRLDALEGAPFVVYPNPVSSEIHISNPASAAVQEIQLYNAMGQLIFAEQTTTQSEYLLQVADYATGIYYIVLNVDDRLLTTKIKVER